MPEAEDTPWSADEEIRILIASDIHLGHDENDAIRGDDSFIAFEEVLSQAVQYDVDLILLGGDLFDHSKPSPSCMFKCTQIMRKYCFGDKPVSVEILSDQLENFTRPINYEDPNLNISFPILSIHGNHDDPVGRGSVSSLDILSITGLVNYFGKWTDYSHVRISPVLLQKGETKLALYGLSHLKDKRLAHLFAEKKVEIEIQENGDSWFNLLVLHQNRADRGPGNYIREDVLPKFLDLVVWGHEHDSLVYPMKKEKSPADGFFVVQPGSTVATSLAAGEALPKHCALLQINKKEFNLTPIPLKTVRPFIFKTVVLSEENIDGTGVNENEKVQDFLKGKVNEAIEEANKNRSGDPRQPQLPLVRLNVFYEHEGQDFSRVRFSQNFTGLIANPNDVIIMKKEKKIRERKVKDEDVEVEMREVAAEAVEAADVEALLRAYYAAQPPGKGLTLLSVNALTDAVRDFTLKHDDDVFRRVFEFHKQRAVADLMQANVEADEDIKERLRSTRNALDSTETENLRNMISTTQVKKQSAADKKAAEKRANNYNNDVMVLSSDDDEPVAKGRGRGRGARGARGGRGRGAKAANSHVQVPLPLMKLSPQVKITPLSLAKVSPPPAPDRRTTPRRSAAVRSRTFIQDIAERRSRRTSSDIDDSD